MVNKKTNLIIGALLVAIGILIGISAMTISDHFGVVDSITNNDSLEDELFQLIKEHSYYYENDEVLKEGMYNGIVNALDDPYSVYLSTEQNEQFENHLNNKSAGIGISVVKNGTYPMIIYVMPDSPADKAGIEIGHSIKTVNGTDIENMEIVEIGNLIRGKSGAERTIGVFTINPSVVINIDLDIEVLTSPTIDHNFFIINNKRIGYIKIDGFLAPTYEEFKLRIEHLESKNLDSLIIDVRNNPGGYLTSVQSILDYLLNTDEAYMYSQAKNQDPEPYYLEENEHVIDYEMVVLVNELSASSSEIFASAMNEIGNVEIIGTTTYGKGVMQSTYSLNEDETIAVKLTTKRWLTPSGEWIQGIGVHPTIEVEQTNFIGLGYINPEETIEYDTVNQEVMEVQEFLNRKGFSLRTDGYFDEDTKIAVMTYQLSKELPQTGVVNRETAYQINLDIINYLNNIENDNQYQKALEYILNQ